jgi:uncharacterized membrane protein HdeD (DUF308 family)
MQESGIAQAMRGSWWMIVLRGVLAIILGLIALLNPIIALVSFIYVFAAYACSNAILAVVTAIRERSSLNRWGWVLFEGIVGILVAIAAFLSPVFAALVLLSIVAGWAIVTGIMQIVAAVALRAFLARELGLA